jgi:hypothetical protein
MHDLLKFNYLLIRKAKPAMSAHEAFCTARSDAQRNRETYVYQRKSRLSHGDVLRTRDVLGDRRTFAIAVLDDDTNDSPWEREDGHGPVSDWTSCAKRPGEIVLSSDRGMSRFYDYQEACKIALRDGWNAEPYSDTESKRQRASKAAMADYERLRAWCNDQWRYIGVVLFEMPRDGEYRQPEEYANSQPFGETESHALWGIESDCEEYISEIALELLREFN